MSFWGNDNTTIGVGECRNIFLGEENLTALLFSIIIWEEETAFLSLGSEETGLIIMTHFFSFVKAQFFFSVLLMFGRIQTLPAAVQVDDTLLITPHCDNCPAFCSPQWQCWQIQWRYYWFIYFTKLISSHLFKQCFLKSSPGVLMVLSEVVSCKRVIFACPRKKPAPPSVVDP